MKKVSTLVLLIMLLLTLTAIPSFGFRSSDIPDEAGLYKEGEILVKYKKGVSEKSKAKVKGQTNSKRLKSFEFIGVEHVKLPPGKSVEQAIEEFEDMPEVEYVEPNHIKKLQAIPNDERYSSLWGLTKASLPSAWNVSKGSTNTIVAVLDTGVAYNHPDLQSNMWINSGEIAGNNIDDDNNGYIDDYQGFNFGFNDYEPDDPMDIDDHGTHVAGTIGAKGNNSIGISGVNWNVKIMPVNVFSNGGDLAYTDDIIAGLDYVRTMRLKGHKIAAINSSYGGNTFTLAEYDAIERLKDAGVLLVAAAGNGDAYGNGLNNDIKPVYPASYDLANIISVAATDTGDKLTQFSNYGYSVDIAAPGEDILSTVISDNEASVSSGTTSYQASAMSYAGTTELSGISATVYNCGKGLNSSDFPVQVAGNIALIERGEANFSVKVTNAQNAGAVGAIIYNNVEGNFLGTLGAPGDWIPAVSVSRADGLALSGQGMPFINLTNTFGYSNFSGTSMATPHVTGVAALLASYNSNYTYLDIKNRIIKGVDKLPSLTGKVSSGGRLNAYKAFDITPPVLSVTAPVNGKHVKGYISFSGTASDPKSTGFSSGISNVKIFRGTSILKSIASSSFSYKYNSTSVQNGKHTFKIVATDKAANTHAWSRYYIVDNTSPVVTRAYIQPSVPKRGTSATAYFRVSDTYSPKVNVTLQVRRSTGALVTSKPLSWQSKDQLLKTSLQMPGAAGQYVYRVMVVDKAGNRSWKDIAFTVQ